MGGFKDFLRMALRWWSSGPAAPAAPAAVPVRLAGRDGRVVALAGKDCRVVGLRG